ncbi:MAG: phosphotransferase [Magnetococcales bacterium]|nr:phosphotransferase [Magnetococcales bacterium]
MTTGNVSLNESGWNFLKNSLGEEHLNVSLAAGDASFRRYFRVRSQSQSWILMDAPPARENSQPFVDIARFLRNHGVPVPNLQAIRLEEGFLLLEDFGDTTYLKALDAGEAALPLYEKAVDILLDIQATPVDDTCIAHRRPFDRAMLRQEMALLTDWYIEGILQRPISPEDRTRFDTAFHSLLDGILEQPVVFVHRDYHSRNLMWLGDGVGVLDFQDAVMGPVTYDLASLLRDCYVAWDADFRQTIAQRWLTAAGERLGYRPNAQQFSKDLEWMSIQRNLKAVGIFGRLSLRDGKHGYLNDIPRTLTYVRDNLQRHPQLELLQQLLDTYLPADWGKMA